MTPLAATAMLTGNLVRVRFARDRIIPCYLDPGDGQFLQVAEQLIDLYRAAVGQPRGRVDAEVEELFGDLPQPQIHQGLAKLLEDRCEFEMLPGHPPDQLREAVFRAATAFRQQPGVRFDREQVLAGVATQLGLSVADVEAGLFSDLKSEQRLTKFDETTPQRLLERYNVALVQAILLRAVGVEATVHKEPPARYRQLLRQIKFHRLICDIDAPKRGSLRLRLDGPLSLFSATNKYGLQLALFLPTLLLCADFELTADVRWGPERRAKTLKINGDDGLVSHQAETGMFVPPEVPMFAELFRKKATDWDLEEAGDVIPLGDRFWVPDFTLTHRPSGHVVHLDVLGFWRRSSLERHLELLRTHADRPFLLAISDQLKVDEAELEGLPGEVLRFRNLPLPDEVVKRAAKLIE